MANRRIFLLLALIATVSACGSGSETAPNTMFWDGDRIVGVDSASRFGVEPEGELNETVAIWGGESWVEQEIEPGPEFASHGICPSGFDCAVDLEMGVKPVPLHFVSVDSRPVAATDSFVIVERSAKYSIFESRLGEDGEELPANRVHPDVLRMAREASGDSNCFENLTQSQSAADKGLETAQNAAAPFLSSWQTNPTDQKTSMTCTHGADSDTFELDLSKWLSNQNQQTVFGQGGDGSRSLWLIGKGQKPELLTEPPLRSSVDSNGQKFETVSQVKSSGETFWAPTAQGVSKSLDGLTWQEVDLPIEGEGSNLLTAPGGLLGVSICNDRHPDGGPLGCEVLGSNDDGKTWQKLETEGYLLSVGPAGVATGTQVDRPDTSLPLTEVELHDYEGQIVADQTFDLEDVAVGEDIMLVEHFVGPPNDNDRLYSEISVAG